MSQFTSKELYIMNGGQKMYIYRDGFGDVYNATPAEENEWQQELISKQLSKLDTESNDVVLKFAINNLYYHQYPALKELLLEKLYNAEKERQVSLATALWSLYAYEKSYEIIHQNFIKNRPSLLHKIFTALDSFGKNEDAKKFLIDCLEGRDEELISKAGVTLTMWAYTGLAALRYDNSLEILKPVNKGSDAYIHALENIKTILFNKK